MSATKIEWATHTWNPVTGCTKISAGCKNCYAERIARRFYSEPFDVVKLHPDRLEEPEHWKKPRRVFVCSMSDLFHKDVPDEFIEKVFMVMELKARQHTFMILTKRPVRMKEFMDGHHECVQSHIWLGVTAENQELANERIPILLQAPAVNRFVSVEPMLERIDLVETGALSIYVSGGGVGNIPLSRGIENNGLDWVICGGESGSGARPHPPYIDIRYLKDQCQSSGIPFFLKQMWGEKMPELDGKIWDEYPKVNA